MSLKSLIILCLFILSSSFSFAQSSTALKRKKQALQREINLLQRNANRAAKNKKLTLSQINALNAKIGLMQEKIGVINTEIRNLDHQISENTHTVTNLKGQLGQLKDEYAAMMRFAQRNRSSYERMMFIFASQDFNQAYKRIKYLQQFGQYRKKQADYIQGRQKDLKYKIVILDKNLKEKSNLLQEQENDRAKLDKNKSEQALVLNKYSRQEKQYKQDIAVRRKKQARLDRDIRAAILRDIAIAKKKADAAERAAVARARAANKKAPAVKAKTSGSYLNASAGSAKLSSNFQKNRGSLPWPVNGTITERFGKHMEGQASYINDGINIETAPGAAVHAVFAGTVRIASFQYGVYFILIKHGEYYTVYQNLKSVSVAVGSQVTTRQTIGIVANDGGRPQLQFQIRRGKVAQNPEGWISK